MRTITFFIILFALPAFAEVVTYFHDVKGIQPGLTTYTDLIKKWGKPKAEKSNAYGHHLDFGKVTVTFSRSKKVVNTIIIYDRAFVDQNGVSVGSSERLLENLDTCLVYAKGNATDLSKGIHYWSKNGLVEKIVYSAASVIDKEKIKESGRNVSRQCDFK